MWMGSGAREYGRTRAGLALCSWLGGPFCSLSRPSYLSLSLLQAHHPAKPRKHPVCKKKKVTAATNLKASRFFCRKKVGVTQVRWGHLADLGEPGW